jgi:hypothetical protein
MKEHLLHFIWQNKLFNTKDLRTATGSALQVIDFGKYNKDGGPDFHNAKIKIDEVTWIGNIELHIHASDWKMHGHHRDKKYNSVILHVVYFNDVPGTIPTLELNGRISPILLEKYEGMMLSRKELICSEMLDSVDTFTAENWKERMVIERLERKSREILQSLNSNSNDWEQTCYQLLAKYFGSHINKEAFEMLAQFLPYKIILKHRDNAFQLEALLFGTAGFLENDFEEQYPAELKREYHFLKHKYQLKSLQEHQWQFLRMRPVSFPTIRIAWFAQLLKKMPLFNKLLSTDPGILLKDVEASSYWTTHYLFDKPCNFQAKVLGNDFHAVLVVNVFAPLLYSYAKFSGDDKFMDRAFSLLYETHAEINSKTKIFSHPVWEQQNSFHSQAVIEAYDSYCSKKRCLECSVGHKILRG